MKRAWRSAPTAKRAPGWAWMSATSKIPAAPGIAITNFDNEMIGLYRASRDRRLSTISQRASGVGCASRNTLGFGCMFFDADLDGLLDLVVANGHIDETVRNIRGNVGYAQAPQLFLNERRRKISRRGERSRRRFRHAESRPRPGLRRLRQRRRRWIFC